VLAAARALAGWWRLELDRDKSTVRLPVQGMRLDLGGIGKGYILQRALDTLRAEGVTAALIEAGGDIVAGEPPPGTGGWTVKVGCAAIAGSAVPLRNAAIATSGASAQFVDIAGVRYSHVVDPRTGLGLTDHVTVHVLADDGASADAWATALGVIGPAAAADMSLPDDVRFCFVERSLARTTASPPTSSSGGAVRRAPL
jgi:thiamine biosynthesis lipoprotein